MYFGPPRGLASYFETEVGIKCPPLWSPADFALEVVANSSSEIEPPHESTLPETTTISAPTEEVLKNVRQINHSISTDILAEAYSHSQLGQFHAQELESIRSQNNQIKLKLKTYKKIGVCDWFDQTWTLIKVREASAILTVASYLLSLNAIETIFKSTSGYGNVLAAVTVSHYSRYSNGGNLLANA